MDWACIDRVGLKQETYTLLLMRITVGNPREEKVAEKYKASGWKVLRGGAPDFLMLKVEDGKIREVVAVEVKSPKDRLKYEQKVYKMILEKAGFHYKVEVEK